MPDCVFCKIIAGGIPSTKVYEDEHVYAFRDLNPQAPTHILVVPKPHMDSLDTISPPDANDQYELPAAWYTAAVARCLYAIVEIAQAEGLTNGYRVITNVGADGGQTVFHLHFHLLGGKPLGALLPD